MGLVISKLMSVSIYYQKQINYVIISTARFLTTFPIFIEVDFAIYFGACVCFHSDLIGRNFLLHLSGHLHEALLYIFSLLGACFEKLNS